MTPDGPQAALAHYQALTSAAVRETLTRARLPPYLQAVVGEYPQRGGKALRPALLLASCQAHGGRLGRALGPAAALELLHNAFLVHDDIADGSRLRRGRATLHELYGIGLAVTGGDALADLALASLHTDELLGPREVDLLVWEMRTLVRQTIEGQALELEWRRTGAVELQTADYVTLAGKKTCWYTTVAPLRMGALLAVGERARLKALSRFGFHLGLAFQIRDDLLDLQGDPEELGKDVGADLRERKRTLMVLHLLGAARGGDRAEVVAWLNGEGPASDDDCTRLFELMSRYGSLEDARERGNALAAAARTSLEEAVADLPDSEHLTFLRQLTAWALDRRS